jgi:hypothetical protein
MPKPTPARLPQKALDLAKTYTLERCRELLELEPEFCHRLYRICQGEKVPGIYEGNRRTAVKRDKPKAKAAVAE